jgi:hypothetical protein
METFAAFVTCSGNDKDVVDRTVPNGIGEELMSSARRGEFTAADIYDMSSRLYSLRDCSGEIELGAGSYRTIGSSSENWHNQTTTIRRDPFERPVMLTENHTGDVSAMFAGWPEAGGTGHQSVEPSQVCGSKARMRLINWAVQDGDAHATIAQSLIPEHPHPANIVSNKTAVAAMCPCSL